MISIGEYFQGRPPARLERSDTFQLLEGCAPPCRDAPKFARAGQIDTVLQSLRPRWAPYPEKELPDKNDAKAADRVRVRPYAAWSDLGTNVVEKGAWASVALRPLGGSPFASSTWSTPTRPSYAPLLVTIGEDAGEEMDGDRRGGVPPR